MLHISLNCGIIELASDQTLRVEDGVVRVDGDLKNLKINNYTKILTERLVNNWVRSDSEQKYKGPEFKELRFCLKNINSGEASSRFCLKNINSEKASWKTRHSRQCWTRIQLGRWIRIRHPVTVRPKLSPQKRERKKFHVLRASTSFVGVQETYGGFDNNYQIISKENFFLKIRGL